MGTISSGRPSITWIVSHSLTKDLHATARIEPAAELQKLGWNVTMIAVGDKRTTETLSRFRVETFSRPDIYFIRQLVYHLLAAFYVLRHWRSTTIVFFQHDATLWLLPLILLSRLTWGRRPLFVMDSRNIPMTFINRRARLRASFDWIMYRLGRRWADGHTAITQHMADAIHIEPDRIWGIWPSGVNLERFLPVQSRHEWPQDDEAIHLMYVGALYPERNVAAACQAVLIANQNDMNFRFTIVGGGPEESKLDSLADKSQGAIRRLAPVPHEQIPDLLATAHVGVMVSPDTLMYQVSSPIKLFEYLGAGMPVLASAIVCNSDVVGDESCAVWIYDVGVDGILVALQDCWSRRDLLPEMSVRAAAVADHWTWAASAQKLDAALRYGIDRYAPHAGSVPELRGSK